MQGGFRCQDQSGTIYDIEIQIAVKPGLWKRLVFYGAELFANQLRAGDDYRKLQPVVIIALVEDSIWRELAQRHHRFALTDRESGRLLEDTLSIHIVEMGKYNLKFCRRYWGNRSATITSFQKCRTKNFNQCSQHCKLKLKAEVKSRNNQFTPIHTQGLRPPIMPCHGFPRRLRPLR